MHRGHGHGPSLQRRRGVRDDSRHELLPLHLRWRQVQLHVRDGRRLRRRHLLLHGGPHLCFEARWRRGVQLARPVHDRLMRGRLLLQPSVRRRVPGVRRPRCARYLLGGDWSASRRAFGVHRDDRRHLRRSVRRQEYGRVRLSDRGHVLRLDLFQQHADLGRVRWRGDVRFELGDVSQQPRVLERRHVLRIHVLDGLGLRPGLRVHRGGVCRSPPTAVLHLYGRLHVEEQRGRRRCRGRGAHGLRALPLRRGHRDMLRDVHSG